MTRYKKGTVVLVLFPNSDLVTAKRRPALVVQADKPATGLEQAIVALITSNLTRDGHPSRVRINKISHEGKQAGLLTDSIIMADNLATVRWVEIDKAVGALPSMSAVDEALKVTFGLNNA
jgi:mRNA interferase MazF